MRANFKLDFFRCRIFLCRSLDVTELNTASDEITLQIGMEIRTKHLARFLPVYGGFEL